MDRPLPITLSIPKPCHEDWNKMTQQEQGRFCAACNKCVVDFTGWSDAAVYRFVTKMNEPVCGRFTTDQLERDLRLQPPEHNRLPHFFLGIGLTLIFSQLPKTAHSQVQSVHQLVNEPDSHAPECATCDSVTSIKGKILDSIGLHPVADGRVELCQQGKLLATCVTDKHGQFSFVNLAAGHYQLRLRHKEKEQFLEYIYIDEGTVYNKDYMSDDRKIRRQIVTGRVAFDTPMNRTNDQIEVGTPVPPSKKSFLQKLLGEKK